MRKLRVRDDTQTGPGLGPTVNPTVCSQAWPPICCLPLGQSYPPGLFVSLYVKDIQAPGGLQGSRPACEEKTQFPLFFLTTPCSGPLKPLCKKTFMSLLLIFRKREQRCGLSKVTQPVQTAGPSRGRHWRVPTQWTWGFTPRTNSLYTSHPSLDIPTCKTGYQLPPQKGNCRSR